MKKIFKTLLLTSTLAVPLAWAQMPTDHGSMTMQQMQAHTMPMADSMTAGVIRKIDKENGKVTIKHGDIKNLDMPSMTMVFDVKDKAMLGSFSVGDKVEFIVINKNGQLLITDLQPTK